MSQFSLPRSPVSASVLLDQGVSRPGDVFVMEREPHHDGAETVLEMLNRRGGIFAFRPADDEAVLLMSEVHTLSVSVDRRALIASFVNVLLGGRGERLYLLPDEPVTMVKDGKSRKVSRQPLTDQHIYALLVEVAPSESADRIDQMAETEFEYVADRGLVRVRIVPEGGRLTAMVAPLDQATPAEPVGPAAAVREAPARSAPRAAASPAAVPRPPKPSAIAAAPMVEAPAPTAAGTVDFAAPQYKGAERALGELLKALVQSASSDLHLRVGEPPVFRTHGEMKRQATPPLSSEQLEMMLLSVMPERNRGEWKETGDSDFAYEIKIGRAHV